MRRRTDARDLPFRLGTGFFALVLLFIVVGIGIELWRSSAPTIHQFGFQFWRTSTWNPVSGEFGALPFIWGTLYSSLLALLISTPIALGIAIFLSEQCPAALRQPLTFLTDLLAAIPSIIYGLWGIFVLVPAVRSVQLSLPDAVRTLPLFSGPPIGVSLISAALILAIMVIPFTSAVAREVLKAVPLAQREAAYALGSTWWEATKAALYYARIGIVGAVVLGLGRALGETMAVTMVIGNTPQIVASIFAPQYTMAAVIANEFTEAGTDEHRSALIEIGLVLFVITLIVNVISRLLIWNMTRHRAPRLAAGPLVSAPEDPAA